LGLAALGLVVAVLGLAVPAFAVPLVRLVAGRRAVPLAGRRAVLLAGFAARADRAAVLDVRAAVPDVRAAVPDGRAADRDREAVPDGLVADRDREPLDDLAAERDRAAGRAAADALGAVLACDMVFAAAVSDLAAVVMALVAVFIACMAVDIVLAEDVALVAAAVILLAAEVTFVAADETVRAALAVDGALAEPVERVDLVLLLLLLVLLALRCGRLAARAGVLLRVDLVRALAEVRRAVVLVVVRAGTDLPPSRSITEVLFHQQHRFTHLIAAYLQNNGRKQTKIAANSPRERGRAHSSGPAARRKMTSSGGTGQAVTGRRAPRLPGPCRERRDTEWTRPQSPTAPPGRPSLAGPGRRQDRGEAGNARP
jgi:hypothetical protein